MAAAEHVALAALKEDVDGQIKLALSREDWYKQWGRCYLVSIAFAHLHQLCNNFKDPGVQVYGGKMFKECQTRLTDLFLSLPAPTPTGYRSYDS